MYCVSAGLVTTIPGRPDDIRWLIVVISIATVAAIVVVIAVVFIVLLLWKRRKQRSSEVRNLSKSSLIVNKYICAFEVNA